MKPQESQDIFALHRRRINLRAGIENLQVTIYGAPDEEMWAGCFLAREQAMRLAEILMEWSKGGDHHATGKPNLPTAV